MPILVFWRGNYDRCVAHQVIQITDREDFMWSLMMSVLFWQRRNGKNGGEGILVFWDRVNSKRRTGR